MKNKSPRPERRQLASGNRLSQRWAFILCVAATVGYLAGAAAGPASGITAAVLVVGLLHAILD